MEMVTWMDGSMVSEDGKVGRTILACVLTGVDEKSQVTAATIDNIDRLHIVMRANNIALLVLDKVCDKVCDCDIWTYTYTYTFMSNDGAW
jgi:hypothetical protein